MSIRNKKLVTLTPARIDFADPSAPLAPDFGDVYHSRAGALAQARHVFLGANGLPGRWAGRDEFVILETGFGLGNNFLATWEAWRQDSQRCERLVFISIEKHPVLRADLTRAHAQSELPEQAAALLAAWPPLTPDLHRLSFEQGQVQLLLCFGDAQHWLRELVAEVDAFYLDGFNPQQNPEMWDRHLLKALGRHAAPGATAGSWSVAPQVREGLTAAGFEVERQRGFANKGGMCVARYLPRHQLQKPAARAALAPGARTALVLGAGLAGAACAWALAQRGIACTVIDEHGGPAQASSGNPGGLFHGTLNPDDGIHARFNRAAALETERVLRSLPDLPWLQRGLLRVESERDAVQMQALIERLSLPPDYVQAMDAAQAQALSGLALDRPAWFYPGGGALPPAAYVAALLAHSRAALRWHSPVLRLSQNTDASWQAWGADGQLLGEAPLLVLAGGHRAQALLQDLAPDLPLLRLRGQLSHVAEGGPRPLRPVAGQGYAIADPDKGFWCGATSQENDPEAELRVADHAHNLGQFADLAGLGLAQAERLQASGGRVGWRLATPDRLPLVGGLTQTAPAPSTEESASALPDQLRFMPRRTGLAVCMALGSRGIGWAALCAQVLAAQVTGAPVPLPASLIEAIDPARFLLRRQRQGRSAG
ncbi:FAD-dependent 5-carboxymethylaminomethyl-2-thiouridine(34) oxidoreductase MnmC [Paucibacter sp. DJ2R-2]|uniref:FAD-dependent 5-carboxymethylaminomethyl-2-thiouridine(34) oxidoreductase MnmC n=1 Tax=Paucibacter sp. DJ2R-2 TaxID=2893558 RepID=UPI0021E47F09|nr:FAD-dependent 5-carboxymethylaminomethyl-2-thiouridine(34) oxidoreductase MnmC [Paucibacter sp. DJ2R-2]MCV2423251.1 FAD-dependent 5-carboxymethylaminomethyl-2-thiouridine(34) oxidoreductase MnmC [Paucibacter sp. DJ4R-1]MCV2440707.1 FAD-dependent 5-carboxymethylaminomethyl-2-thiouridine(34) oxidoreductase MnmC [Paucibacter sp. DJ2R-2]